MKKIISVLLIFATLLSCVGIMTVSANAEYVEVSSVENLKKALESNGDKNVVVTEDIIYTCNTQDIGSYWITVGSGKKSFNLNGHSVELNADSGAKTTMLRVPTGADLTINDTSADNSGRLWCYGRMETPRTDMGPRYFNDTVKYRNVLEIDGGTVTVNGGTLEAGRSKKQWIYNGRDVYDLRHLLDYALQGGVLAVAIGARYDGYAWQQVNGDCITVKDGSLMVNNGVFLGRGFSNLETFVKENDNDVDVAYSRAQCLKLLGGTTRINGGTFWGRGNADVVNTVNDAKLTIKSGTFSTNHLRVLLVPTINVTLTGYWEPYVIGHAQRYGYQYHPASDVGRVGITSDMLDPQRNTAELNGEIIPVSEWGRLNYTSNDGSSTVVITHHFSNADRRNRMSGKDTRKEITNLNINGTNAYGMSLSPDILSCDTEGVRSISVEWYHNDELADEDAYMIAGKYQAKVSVILNSGYAFSDTPNFSIMGDKVSKFEVSGSKRIAILWSKVYEFECNHSYNEDTFLHYDIDNHFLRCSVCDKVISSEEHYFGDGTKDGELIIYKCQRCDYTYNKQDDGKSEIGYVNVVIGEPETGKKPDYYKSLGGEGISFADGGDEFTKDSVRWSKVFNDQGIGENDIIASGIKYRAKVFLRADEGYTFRKNHKGEYDMFVYVNGQDAKYEIDGDNMTVFYEANAPEVVLSSVDMKGIDYPEVGNTPDCTPESEMPYCYDAKKDSGSVTWYEDGKYMNKTDTFKAGKTYSVKLYVDAVRVGWDDIVTFAETMSATLNGFSVKPENVERLTGNTVVISYTFPVLEQESASSFSDVNATEYYYDPVMWAVENGITSGTGADTFSPGAVCTRGQVVTFLHRMIGSPEPAAQTLPFTDVKESDYFYKPVKWAYASSITGGTTDTTFSPATSCTRAQVVTFLWRTAGQPKAQNANNPFSDVNSGTYYYDAVLWAVERGITGGTSATTFSPDAPCTRGQVVTFLYRFEGGQ
ncbi:MAG: S-layer homology domain-containing protein [Ruminococcaceae bacterium]|nr:S-layer homology domain-containing protein [Oscillospiraceae bacterium]